MDFPLFHLDFMGNRMLVAIIAILHVLINHALAVGFAPLVTVLEFRGYLKSKTKPNEGKAWDEMARKLMFFAFIITTSVGALTGVGIWFATSLANPASLGSLIRVFYFAWFTEWIIFVLEVIFIMIYFLTWKRSNESPRRKRQHILFGVWLSIFSWLTMAIIVGILAFMMDPGSWVEKKSLVSGFLNPIYLPQLIFRTPVAMMMAGCVALMVTAYVMKKQNTWKTGIMKYISFWILLWMPLAASGAFIYYWHIPRVMIGNLPVAIGTQQFQNWYGSLVTVMIVVISIGFLVGILGTFSPRRLPKHLLIIPVISSFLFLGVFERLREFIRKPYVIGEYMYANGILVEEYPLYQQTGLLKHTPYSALSEITEENKLPAGEAVFTLTCTRCHTTHGINSVVKRFELMYGTETPLNEEAMKTYMKNMHNVRYYMPPFPGNDEELGALAAWIAEQQRNPKTLEGPQIKGVEVKEIEYKLQNLEK
ncbi:cytochrome c [Mariniphaga sediminis]|uniref:Cytochrome c n=1 Tax=Mariniphaga sediminis TaxID=1628158 RepID=A0A399CZL8_9BACT|nr:cytochrome c [Mariniphaga sediminis]RIH64869.1 cytochrome c [Mariniphaga sediminis]